MTEFLQGEMPQGQMTDKSCKRSEGRKNTKKRIMRKIFSKYTIRIVLGLFTLLWGLAAWAALYPDEDYHHCESGQDEMSATTCVIIACASLLMFCLVWYATMDKRTANEK